MSALNELLQTRTGATRKGLLTGNHWRETSGFPSHYRELYEKNSSGYCISKQSLALERFMKVNNGFEMENIGGLAYTTEERRLILFRILCSDAKLVDMEKE